MSATAIFQDISDNKRLEELRLRAERLEAVAELSASLAHEIKNPLASIRSAVEQLAPRPRATDDERMLAHADRPRVRSALAPALRVPRLRARARDARRARGHRRGRAAARAASPPRTPTASSACSVTCVIPTETLLVEGDEDLLHRAIFNITLNAVQAAPADTGRVTVEVVAG